MDGGTLRRARWRLRGAWLAPAFVVSAVADAVLLHELPVTGDRGFRLFGGLLIGGFANLLMIVVLAPLAGRLLRRRRPDLPRLVARNYGGTALVGLVTVALLGGGLAHRPAVRAAHEDFLRQALAVARYVHAQAPAYRAGMEGADTIELGPRYYRTCVPGGARRHPLCLYVDTSQNPPGITVDHHPEPNSSIVRFQD